MADDAHLHQPFKFVVGKVRRLRVTVVDDTTGQPLDLTAVPLRLALTDPNTRRRAEASTADGSITVAGNVAAVILDGVATGLFRGLSHGQQTWLLWVDRPTPADDPLAGGPAQGMERD